MRIPILSSLSSSGVLDLSNANIVCHGNSLTFGQGSTSGLTYPKQLENQLNADGYNVSVTNLGVGGQTTIDMIGNAPTLIPPLFVEGVQNILIAWEIRNDFTNNEPTSQVAYDNFIDYCELVKTFNNGDWFLVVASVMPSWKFGYKGDNTVVGYELLDSDRLSANTLLRANFSPADSFVDIGAISGISMLGDNEQEGYVFSSTRPTASANGNFNDGTHMFNQGYGVVANAHYQNLKQLAIN